MQIKVIRSATRLYVGTSQNTLIYWSHHWNNGLLVEDFLLALCGKPDAKGWYVYHELDDQWMRCALKLAGRFNKPQIGAMAIRDSVGLRSTPLDLLLMALNSVEPSVSIQAAGSLAVHLFERAYQTSTEDAADLVRMNLFTERRVAV